MTSPARRQARLGAYIDHYSDFFPTRPLAIIGLVIALGDFVSPTYGVVFGLLNLPLYGLLYIALRQARRDRALPGAFRRFAWATGVIAVMISIEFSLLSLDLYNQGSPAFRSHARLLLTAVVVLTALQVHMTTAGYLTALAPPVISFVAIGVMTSRRYGDTNMAYSVVLFMAVLIAVTWRQQATDRKLGQMSANLAGALEDAQSQRYAAESASRAKSRLLATASHEIRTPLNAILGLAEGLRRKAENPEQRELAEGVVTSGEMLMRLLSAVLDLSRMDAGRALPRPEIFDLHRMLDDVASVWRGVAEAQRSPLTVERIALPEPCWLVADKGRIEQTLVNLVSNALKFSAGAPVTIRAGLRNNMLRLEVADRGPGVAETHRARIFEPFEQTDEGRDVGGAGLGLAICRGNVELLGGRIGLAETTGGGATFRFEVPVKVAMAPVDLPAPAEAAPGDGPPQRRLRVLAAEDNAANRRVIQVLLEPFDVDLTLVENGREAVEAFGLDRFDLVLMDAQMPVMGGVEAIRAIREAEPPGGVRTPIHMLTANVFEEDVAGYGRAGADGVLAKPISLAELAECVASARAVQAPEAAEEPERRTG